jgi:hypothetical protein
VQFEAGSIATPFERPVYPTQLAQCQRYCCVYSPNSTAGQNSFLAAGFAASASSALIGLPISVTFRTAPTLVYTGSISNWFVYIANGGTYSALSSMTYNGVSSIPFVLLSVAFGSGASAGQGVFLVSDNSKTAYLILSAEM